MTAEEFSQWRDRSIPAYAADKVRTERWTEQESLSEAEKEFGALLPQGLDSTGHTLYTIANESGQSVGAVWLARTERTTGPIGYIYDLVVWEAHRRKGHAERAMHLLEAEAVKMGFNGLALHVFGHNVSAQALYRRLGYEPTHINMFKSVARDT